MTATDRPPNGDMQDAKLSLRKKLLFFVIMLAIPPLFAMVAVLAYYSYKKLEENVVYSESFGRLDGEIGWVLRPNADARVSAQNLLSGEVYYDVRVRTNADGFRAARTGEPSPVGGIVAAGDSWTFGTAVDFQAAYPTQLAARLGMPIVNLGVPAHGTAQTILLIGRHAARLAPMAVVHINIGLWARSVCRGSTRPVDILKPCFWRDPATGVTDLLTPPKGHVADSAARGIYPGGWLTAGHNTWTYYLVSRPIMRINQLLARLGLQSGQVAEDDIATPDREPILAAALDRFMALAERHKFGFVLLDLSSDYRAAVAKLAPERRARLVYLGGAGVIAEIDKLTARVPRERHRVPKDGHYTGEYMAAWVEVLVPAVQRALAMSH